MNDRICPPQRGAADSTRVTKADQISSLVRRHGPLLGGAIGLTLGSRVLGLVREALIVGKIGVHGYTDAYFAVSSLVIWLNNWAFGAFALGFLPRYASLSREAQSAWYRSQVRLLAFIGVTAGALFFFAFPYIERFMLGGRNVLGVLPAASLALCIPITVIAGLANSRLAATAQGIVGAAASQLLANGLALASLFAMLLLGTEKALVLPLTLLISRLCLLFAIILAQRTLASESDSAAARALVARPAQFAASTVENLGFNLSAVGQQAIAGVLPSGAVTMNAYAVRLILIPFTSMMGPVQQRLFVRYTSIRERVHRRELRLAVGTGLVLGVVVGGALAIVLMLSRAFWNPEWQARFTEHKYPLTLLAYGIYAGVVFSCQALARSAFAAARGWSYATVMLSAYALGTVGKFFLAPHIGILALPLCATAAELAAACTLLIILQRASSDASDIPGPLATGYESVA